MPLSFEQLGQLSSCRLAGLLLSCGLVELLPSTLAGPSLPEPPMLLEGTALTEEEVMVPRRPTLVDGWTAAIVPKLQVPPE
jgi:hypothetical protein